MEEKHGLIIANSLSCKEAAQISLALIEQSKQQHWDLRISLLYVKPYFPVCYFHIPSMMALAEEFEAQAQRSLRTLGEILRITADNQWIVAGRVRSETIKLAKTISADFVISNRNIQKELDASFGMKKRGQSTPVIKTLASLITERAA